MSEKEPTLIAMDAEAKHQLVHGHRFSKTHGATDQPFHPGP